MSVGWILDALTFETYHDEMVDAIKQEGHQAISLCRPNAPYSWSDTVDGYRKAYPPNSCVIAHADIDLVQRIRRDKLWTPGVFAAVERFHCSQYYIPFAQYLLNRNHTMVPYGELPSCRVELFGSLGKDGRLFVRPDSPLKLFTGMIIREESFDADYKFMGFYEFPAETLVVVCEPQAVIAEWRFVVAGGELVSGSLYAQQGERTLSPAKDSNAIELAATIARHPFQPEPVWILDICKSDDNQYHLLEIGCFSFADLYACDKREVVRAVSAAAEKMYSSSC